MTTVRTDGAARAAGERRSPAHGGPELGSSGRARARNAIVAAVLAAAVVASAPGPAMADVTLAFDNAAITVAPGDTFTVSLVIPQAGSLINGFDVSVFFDPAKLAFVPTTPVANQIGAAMTSACGSFFHRFTPAPDSVKASVSMLCSGVSIAGPGTIYQLRFRALATTGPTPLTFGPFTEFYKAGLFVRPTHTTGMVVTIGSSTGVGPGPGPGGLLEFAPPSPNPGRGGGPLMLDFSLPGSDVVSVDLLDAQGRRLAGRAAESLAGGRHRLALDVPALASGDYFLRVRGRASGSAVRRWTLLR